MDTITDRIQPCIPAKRRKLGEPSSVCPPFAFPKCVNCGKCAILLKDHVMFRGRLYCSDVCIVQCWRS